MDTEYVEKVRQNLGGVLSRIRTASDGREVELLLATKTVSAEVINAVSKAQGKLLIGENKVQELLEKYESLEKDRLEIHLIGHLQTNKVRQIIDKVTMIHSLDRPELATEISKRATAKGIKMPVLVEINIAKEEAKGGVYPENAADFIKSIAQLQGISIKGLMTMAPAHISADEYKEYFVRTKKLFDEIAAMDIDGVEMKTLSMGMSDSYAEAAECGSTLVRVGSAVFGKRIYPDNINEKINER
jgi:pyridoxal phosphate enzyme (YggS family)